MRIELVCVGTELLSGKLNTNVGYIGDRLNSIGMNLDCATTVPDNIEMMEHSFKEIISRSDVVIVTGGLGPTFDDLTREAVAKVLKKELVFNKELLQTIVQRFISRGIEMPKGNERQAYLIDGAKSIVNTAGTAPGQLIELPSTHSIFLLPGPPKEVQIMFEAGVLPYLKQKYGFKLIRTKTLHIYGLSESKVDEFIRPVIETERKLEEENVSFTILAQRSIVDIKISASGKNEIIVEELINSIKRELHQLLGENIYGEDKQSLESVICELMAKKKKTLAIAESCTGGMVSNRMTNIPGASIYFKQGIVVYSNDAKINLLKVSADTLEKSGAVSKETVLEMASGVKKLASSSIGLAITGVAGPTGATQEKPVGTVWFGMVSDKEKIANEMKFHGTRLEIKEFATNCALNLVLKSLLKE